MKMSDVISFDYIIETTNVEFFDLLSNETNYPLVHSFINNDSKQNLRIDYFGGYSADKYVSPLLEKIYDYRVGNVQKISESLAPLIYQRFGAKWKKIYDALMQEYNPLENYSMEEIRTPDLTFEETQNESSNIETERETSASTSYKGFNANDPVLVSKTDGNENATTSGAKLDNEISKETTHTGTETLTRAGNIGVTTSQQMLESEFKVRQYDFYKMMYNDIDSLLCLSVY